MRCSRSSQECCSAEQLGDVSSQEMTLEKGGILVRNSRLYHNFQSFQCLDGLHYSGVLEVSPDEFKNR